VTDPGAEYYRKMTEPRALTEGDEDALSALLNGQRIDTSGYQPLPTGDEIWAEINRIMGQIDSAPKTEHLVDGFLLVTPQQYDALKKMGDDQYFEDIRRDMAGLPSRNNPTLGSVPVLVIYPNKPETLPSGRIAIYRPEMEAIYVMPAPHNLFSSAYKPPTPEQLKLAKHAHFIPDYDSEGTY